MWKRRRLVWIASTILLLLIATGISRYRAAILHSKEEILAGNLGQMREVINAYANDQHKAPQTLQELVDAGYFRELPIDPMTNSNSTWEPVGQGADRGITDVRSGSILVSSKGTLYRTW